MVRLPLWDRGSPSSPLTAFQAAVPLMYTQPIVRHPIACARAYVATLSYALCSLLPALCDAGLIPRGACPRAAAAAVASPLH
eukprot:13273350-Heterocapsa_arctica.AAC.1